VNILEDIIDKLGWQEGNNIDLNISKNSLVFKLKKNEE